MPLSTANSDANPETLGRRPVGRLLWEFSLPSIIATVISASYNLVARIFVGQKIGALGIAALHVSFPVMLIALAFAMMIATGASTLISIQLGQKEIKKAEETLGQALFMFLAVSTLFLVFGLTYLEPLLVLFGASEDVLPLAKSYLSIIIWGTILQEMSYGVNNFIRVEGKPRVAMVTMIVSAVVNIVFDYLFLYVFKTGIWGAAVSNLIALASTSGWVCWLYLSERTVLKWRLRYIRPRFMLMGTIALYGTVPLFTQACGAAIQGIQNYLLGIYGNSYGLSHGFEHGGDMAISVMGTVFAVSMLVLMPILGLSQGMQPIVGYNVGAERPDRVHRALWLTLRTGVTICFACWLVIMLRPSWLVIPFLKQSAPDFQDTFELGRRAIRLVSLCIPFIGVNVIAGSYFQAHGRPYLSLILTLLRQLIFLLPCLLALPPFFKWLETQCKGVYALDGIWCSFSASDFLACGVASLFLLLEYRKHRKRSRNQATAPSADTESSGTSVPPLETREEDEDAYMVEVN